MSIWLVTVIATFGLLLSGIVNAEDLNPVLGKAGDYVIREADLDRLLANQSPETKKSIEASPDQRASFIRQLLLTKATAAQARKEGFDKKPEVRELLGNLLDLYLAQEYVSKVVTGSVTVTDDDLKRYYSEHEKEFQIPAAVKVRHIFISSPKDSAVELKEKAKTKAEGILQKIRKGEDFAVIAREQSEDADSASKGGDLGYISEGKTNSIEFEKALFALKAGETGNVVETPFGFHVIRADERKESRTASLEEAKEYMTGILKEEIKRKKTSDFLEKLTRETGLEIIGKPAALKE